ncbi:MAG TPA: TolC family protein [Thermoanaerobaculia bacterium]|nr:TolC family protein [Thermoanaerobaculia bacterium]
MNVRAASVLRTPVLLAFFLAASSGSPPASAAEAAARSWKPVALTFPADRITLAEAVRTTLANDPNILLQEQQTFNLKGMFQEQSGAFDATLNGTANLNYTRSALTQSQISTEKQKRKDLQTDADTANASGLQSDATAKEYQALLNSPTGYRLSDPIAQAEVDVLNLLISGAQKAGDTSAVNDFTSARTAYITNSVSAYQTARDQAYLVRDQKLTQLRQLGAIPDLTEEINAQIALQFLVPFRSGFTAGLFANGSYDRNRYVGKPENPDFGGMGTPDLWNLGIGFSLDAFLLRGRGYEATGAPEKAARINWEASLLTFKQTTAASVLNTVSAYWALVAAEENLRIARQTFDLDTKRVEVTKALIEGDEIPRAEISRVLASQASDEAALRSAERSLWEARVTLALAMGVAVQNEANAPLAADAFPAPVDDAQLRAIDVPGLADQAVDRRYDRQAALKIREAGGVLLVAARTGLRPQLDFHGKISANSVAESSLAATSDGWSVPSFTLELDFSAPFANNAAHGRLLQSESTYAQQSISATDLERNIRANVVQETRSLQATRAQLARAKESVEAYGRTIESENEKFRSGQSSLIDTILTQQLQTSALQTYAAAQQQYATLLAQLRYETATLMTERGDLVYVQPEVLLVPPGVGAAK